MFLSAPEKVYLDVASSSDRGIYCAVNFIFTVIIQLLVPKKPFLNICDENMTLFCILAYPLDWEMDYLSWITEARKGRSLRRNKTDDEQPSHDQGDDNKQYDYFLPKIFEQYVVPLHEQSLFGRLVVLVADYFFWYLQLRVQFGCDGCLVIAEASVVACSRICSDGNLSLHTPQELRHSTHSR